MIWFLTVSALGNLGFFLLLWTACDARDFYKQRALNLEASMTFWRNQATHREAFLKGKRA